MKSDRKLEASREGSKLSRDLKDLTMHNVQPIGDEGVGVCLFVIEDGHRA